MSQMDWKKNRPVQETKRKKMKTDDSISIYYVFNTSGHQISTRFPYRNVLKSNLKTDAGICISQISEKWANCSKTCPKEGPQIRQKSMKIEPWILMCPLCWPWGLLDRKNNDPRSQKWVPGVKNNAKTSTKHTLSIDFMFFNEFHTYLHVYIAYV